MPCVNSYSPIGRPSEEEPSPVRFSVLQCVLLYFTLFIIPLCLQYPGLSGPMHYDSLGQIQDQRPLFSTGGLARVVGLYPSRGLTMVTFYLNFLMGDMDPRYFRLVNLLLLAGAALAAVLIVHMTLESPGPWRVGDPHDRKMVAILLGIWFAAHPVQIYVTLYIWQRSALMACLFSFAALAVYLAVRTGRMHNRFIGNFLWIFLFLCALLSKENSIVLPAVLLLFEVGALRVSWKGLARRMAVLGVFTVGLVAAASALQHPYGQNKVVSGIGATLANYYRDSGLSLVEVLMTQARMVFKYVQMVLLPLPDKMQLVIPQVISTSLLEPPTTIFAVGGVIGWLFAGVILLRKSPLTGTGMLFFLGTLLPEAVLVPMYSFFGNRPVLPMLGIVLIAADCLVRLLALARERDELRVLRDVVAAVCLGGLIVTGAVTVLKAQNWSSNLLFWLEIAEQLPRWDKKVDRRSALDTLSNTGMALMEASRYSEAIPYYRHALRKGIQQPPILAALGDRIHGERQLQGRGIHVQSSTKRRSGQQTGAHELRGPPQQTETHGRGLSTPFPGLGTLADRL